MSQLFVRCDGSAAMGLGHASRALALAQELGGRLGSDPIFLGHEDPVLVDFLAGRRFEPLSADGYAAAEVVARLAPHDVLVSDSYELDEPALEVVAARGIRHIVVDDFGRLSRWPCEVVVNPNLGAENLPYPGARDVLRGPAYSLLRREIVEASQRRHPSTRSRVLVCFGGGRWPREATTILRALGLLAADGGLVVATTSADVPHGVRAAPPSALADELSRAWVAVLSAGVLKYEAAACGVPAVLLSAVEHQHAVGAAFAASGPATYLGRLETVSPADVAETVGRLLADREERRRMSESGRALVDGRGAERVASCFGKGLG